MYTFSWHIAGRIWLALFLSLRYVLLTGQFRDILAELSSVRDQLTPQAPRLKRPRPDEDTPDVGQSAAIPTYPTPPLHPGEPYSSN